MSLLWLSETGACFTGWKQPCCKSFDTFLLGMASRLEKNYFPTLKNYIVGKDLAVKTGWSCFLGTVLAAAAGTYRCLKYLSDALLVLTNWIINYKKIIQFCSQNKKYASKAWKYTVEVGIPQYLHIQQQLCFFFPFRILCVLEVYHIGFLQPSFVVVTSGNSKQRAPETRSTFLQRSCYMAKFLSINATNV